MWGALAGIGLQAVGSYYQQKTQNAYLKYQASMNRINARLANMSAESALRAGEKQQQQIMTQTAKLKGAQKTGYAANGIDLHSRSVQNVLNETDYFGEADRNQAGANALENAWQYRLQATNYENNANILRSQRQNPWGAALSSAVSGVLGSQDSMKAIGEGASSLFNGVSSLFGSSNGTFSQAFDKNMAVPSWASGGSLMTNAKYASGSWYKPQSFSSSISRW